MVKSASGAIVGVGLALAALGARGEGVAATAHTTAPAGFARRCAALGDGRAAGGAILGATVRPLTADSAGRTTPAHCELTGALERRTGADGQAYAIRYRLRLPEAWNGRFFFEGGGGSDGVLGAALGNLQGSQPQTALQLGYAVAATDAGHANETNDRPEHGGVLSFGWDAAARENYAYRAQALVTVAAKRILARFYGRAPRYAYWVGCSKGGQEGMAMAERYPAYYDGIMANAPGFALPRAALAQVWDTQALGAAAAAANQLGPDALPRLGAAFSDADLALVAGAVLTACDALDGSADGSVARFGACTTAMVRPALAATTCAGEKRAACLLPAQVSALMAVFAGPRDAAGRALYSDWPWDSGVGPVGGRSFTGWRAWKLGSADPTAIDARNVTLGGGSVANIFSTPPRAVPSTPAALLRYEMAFSFDRDAPLIYATAPGFPASAWTLLSAQSDDRAAFRAHGGKLVVVHGVSDPVFSIHDTVRWWDRLNAREHGAAAAFARVFPVPGMNHCGGGPGTTRFDAFTALVNWVEYGAAPDRIDAVAPADTPWPGRGRPLCPYPRYARYRGTGSIEDAASFACVPGARVPALRAGS